MTLLPHTGHAYAAFDRIARLVETWLVGRIPAVAGFGELVVRERLMQRIVEVALWPFVGMYSKRGIASANYLPAPDKTLDCGGIILHPVDGKVSISPRLFAASFFEFTLHWLYVLGAILSGILPHRSSDVRPATLVFGVGAESLFNEGNDSRFVSYRRAGPIEPLARARRLIVQCSSRSGGASTKEFTYVRFPLAALIHEAKLGAAKRLSMLVCHLASPFVLLLAVIRSPLLMLLARDIAYSNAVGILDRARMIETVVITNSAFSAQPLWMRGPAMRHFVVHMVWYSQNTIPFVYARDGVVSDVPNYRHIRVDQTWVWTSGYKAYLEKLGLAGAIHVVGPILWYLPEKPQLRADGDLRIAVFDVTPVQDEVAQRIGLISNYYCATNMIRFIEEILYVRDELESHTGRRVRLLFKHKRSYNDSHDLRYIDLIKRLSAHGAGLELVPFQTNMYSLLTSCDLSIIVPYSSPAYVASHLGIHAVFFDPTTELAPSFEKAPNIDFASGRDELLRLVTDAIGATAAAVGDPATRS